VDIVLISIFQWFGTSCGRADMDELLVEIDKGIERARNQRDTGYQEKRKRRKERAKEIKQERERVAPLLEGQSERVKKAYEKTNGIKIKADKSKASEDM
jgi:hypothetical protein